MFEDDEKPIRYHLPEDFALDFGEPIFLDRLETGTRDWSRQCQVPEDAKTPELLQSFLRETAIKQGGEAWRAMTERGELLRLFSVYQFAKELSGEKTVTIHPVNQYFWRLAHEWLDLSRPY